MDIPERDVRNPATTGQEERHVHALQARPKFALWEIRSNCWVGHGQDAPAQVPCPSCGGMGNVVLSGDAVECHPPVSIECDRCRNRFCLSDARPENDAYFPRLGSW